MKKTESVRFDTNWTKMKLFFVLHKREHIVTCFMSSYFLRLCVGLFWHKNKIYLRPFDLNKINLNVSILIQSSDFTLNWESRGKKKMKYDKESSIYFAASLW